MWLMFVGVLRNSLRKQELTHYAAHAIFELVIFFERNSKMIIIITKIIKGGLFRHKGWPWPWNCAKKALNSRLLFQAFLKYESRMTDSKTLLKFNFQKAWCTFCSTCITLIWKQEISKILNYVQVGNTE